jgi:hypothetical protein
MGGSRWGPRPPHRHSRPPRRSAHEPWHLPRRQRASHGARVRVTHATLALHALRAIRNPRGTMEDSNGALAGNCPVNGLRRGLLNESNVAGRDPAVKLDRQLVPALVLGAGVCLARIPFLFAGYGSDSDAWRVAWTGREIVRTGLYQSSRAPGNPVPEFAAAALSGAPPWALNTLSALLGAAAVMLFGILLRRLGCRSWLAGALALAFTPVVAIHSADAMDYVWALAFLQAAWLAALDRRPGLAGLLVGVATGCRITSLTMLVPLSIVLVAASGSFGRPRGRALVVLWGAGLVTAAAAFAPVIARYGLTFFHGYELGYPRLLYVAKNLTVDVWGVVGCLALVLAAGRVLSRRGRPPLDPALPGGANGVVLAAAVVVAIQLALYFRLPHEAGYLIAAVPFTLLLFARALTRREFMALCSGVVLSSFLVKVSEPGKLYSAPPGGSGITRVSLAGHVLELDVLRGPLVTDRLRREAELRYVERVRAAALRLRSPAVVAAHEWLPFLRVTAAGSREGEATYVYTLTRAQLDSLGRGGVAVYDLPGAEDYTQLMYGYSLRAAGSRPLGVR